MKKDPIKESIKDIDSFLKEAGLWPSLHLTDEEPHDNKHFEYKEKKKSNNKLPF